MTCRGGDSSACVALPGGRIAGKFFSVVADLVNREGLSCDRVHFFWGDERCVPPEHPESNFGLARDRLLLPLRIPEALIHRIRGELSPAEAAREAAAELCGIAPLGGGQQPVLDLILLGMGEEGHIASLFPGEPEQVMRDPAVFRPVQAPKPPPSRITMGYPAIAAAQQVWVLASGAEKQQALEASLLGSDRTPLRRLLGLCPRVRILTDILPVPARRQRK